MARARQNQARVAHLESAGDEKASLREQYAPTSNQQGFYGPPPEMGIEVVQPVQPPVYGDVKQ